MRRTMVTMVVAVMLASLQNPQAMAQPVAHESWDPIFETQLVTSYDSTLKPPRAKAVTKTRRALAQKRPALWLDIYTMTFLTASSIFGALLVSWTLNAKKAKSPRPLFQSPVHVPRSPTSAS